MCPGVEVPDLNQSHLDVVAEAINNLSDQSRQAIEAVFFERASYAQLGLRLGVSKTQAWRIVQRAVEELRELLTPVPLIRRRFNMQPTCWEEAAEAALDSFDRCFARPGSLDTMDYCIRNLRTFVTHNVSVDDYPTMFFSALASEAVMELKDRNMWSRDEMFALLCAKQHDYGHDNINAFGLIGLAVRLSDKVARLHNIRKHADPKNESEKDTLLDIVGYGVIADLLSNGTFQLPLKGAA